MCILVKFESIQYNSGVYYSYLIFEMVFINSNIFCDLFRFNNNITCQQQVIFISSILGVYYLFYELLVYDENSIIIKNILEGIIHYRQKKKDIRLMKNISYVYVEIIITNIFH